MSPNGTDISELEEQLADSQAQIESLQAAAADAAARAETAREQLARVEADREATSGEVEKLRSELETARTAIREAAQKYRAARLSAVPEVPEELVPESDDLAEIDRNFEAASTVIARLRERMEEQARERQRSARVPAGSPSRRAPDLSHLSPGEKIRLGLEQAGDR